MLEASVTLGILLLVALARGGEQSKSGSASEPAVKEPALRRELLEMQELDQKVRAAMLKELGEKGLSPLNAETITDPALLKFYQETVKKAGDVDRKHQARLKEIIVKYGWPGLNMVGKDASQSAWLIAQHADMDPALQKKCLELMKAAPKGEVDPSNVAYLTDRVLIGEKKKQLYGTQLVGKNGVLEPQPIEDEANVDKRRAEVGLPPLADYLKIAQAEYEKLSGKPQEKK